MNKTVLITGASSGFGRASVKLFQNQGWNVIAGMRSPEKEEELKDSENLLLVKLDVTDSSSIKNAVEQGIEKFKTIDVLINSAGYGLMGVFESSDGIQIQKQFEVNVFGLMNMTKALFTNYEKTKKWGYHQHFIIRRCDSRTVCKFILYQKRQQKKLQKQFLKRQQTINTN